MEVEVEEEEEEVEEEEGAAPPPAALDSSPLLLIFKERGLSETEGAKWNRSGHRRCNFFFFFFFHLNLKIKNLEKRNFKVFDLFF